MGGRLRRIGGLVALHDCAGGGVRTGRGPQRPSAPKDQVHIHARASARRLPGLTIRGTRRIFDPTPAHIALLQAKDDGMFRPCHDLMFERIFRRNSIRTTRIGCARRYASWAVTSNRGPGAWRRVPPSSMRSTAGRGGRRLRGFRASFSRASCSGGPIRCRSFGSGSPVARAERTCRVSNGHPVRPLGCRPPTLHAEDDPEPAGGSTARCLLAKSAASVDRDRGPCGHATDRCRLFK